MSRPVAEAGALRTVMTPVISTVLWDCDGVLQHGMQGALDELVALIGADFLPPLFAEELPSLRGEESLRSCVERVIPAAGIDITADQVLPVWDRYELDADAVAVLTAVRSAGYACHLATNQQDYRRDRMRSVSGYDDLVDRSYYSCELGVAKPDPEFFRRITTDLQVDPATVLFIDDLIENVEGARSVGLNAEQHDPADGAPGLRRILAAHHVSI